MRISTDDEQFGFVVTRLTGLHMFRFQLIIAGRIIGDTDPSILGSGMHQLGNLQTFDDDRLSGIQSDPASVIFALRTDEFLHDQSTLSLAESLDRWLVNGFIYDGLVTFLAQDYQDEENPGLLLVSFVDPGDYAALFHAVYGYWLENRTAAR